MGWMASAAVVDCQQNAEREVMDDYVSAELVYHKIKLFFLAVTGARTVECRISVHVYIFRVGGII